MMLPVTIWDAVDKPSGASVRVPWQKLPEVLQGLNASALWSPAEYRDDYHHADNFIRTNAIVLDHDSATVPIDDAAKLLAGERGFIHKTKRPGRWRAVIAVDSPLTADEYRATVTPIASALECAPESCSPYQMWFPPVNGVTLLDERLTTRLQCWIRGDYDNPLVRSDLPRHPGRGTPDRSAIDMKIAHAMVASGASDAELASVLESRGILTHRLDPSYYALTSRNARKKQDSIRAWALRDDMLGGGNGGGDEPKRPSITIGPDLDRVADECEIVLANRPDVYTRAETLVGALGDITHTLSANRIADELSKGTQFIKLTKDGEKVCEPPERVCRILADRKTHLARPIKVIAPFPLVRPDGSVCADVGYDPITQSLFTGPPIDMIDMDSQTALATLREPFSQFPYEHPGMIDIVVALICSIVCRQTIAGNVPLFVLDASKRGAGKSLLATSVSLVALGEHAAMQSWPQQGDGGAAELDKRLSAIALSSAPYASFDEAQVVGGGPLNSLLTCNGKHAFRRLGKSERVTADWLTVLSVAANNIAIVGDTRRRAIVCRLTPGLKAPTIDKDLHQWIPKNRARLLGAALSLVRPLIGVKTCDGPQWPSFEAWARVIAGAIVSAGGYDITQFRPTDDPEEGHAHDVIVQWLALRFPDGATARAITEDLGGSMGLLNPSARALIEQTGIDPRNEPLLRGAKELGLALRNWRQVRTKEGLYLDCSGVPPKWSVYQEEP